METGDDRFEVMPVECIEITLDELLFRSHEGLPQGLGRSVCQRLSAVVFLPPGPVSWTTVSERTLTHPCQPGQTRGWSADDFSGGLMKKRRSRARPRLAAKPPFVGNRT